MDPTSAAAAKKNVPDWLNSSLWSSPRSPSDPPSSRSFPSPSPSQHRTSFPGSAVASKPASPVASPTLPPSFSASPDEHKFSGNGINDTNEDGPRLVFPIREQESKGNHNQVRDESAGVGGHLSFPSTSASAHNAASLVSPVSKTTFFDPRLAKFNAELSKKVISISELQQLASQGIPDSGSIRAITWKLLLHYLPNNRELWSVELEKKRAEYAAFKEELLVTPSEITRRSENEALDISNECRGPLERHDITEDDHPLSLGKSSIWHQFFVDSEVWDQIDRDVKRTHPDMNFFCGDSAASLQNQDAMRRVLFIFSKLNSGIRYVQGMNEVLAPLYYVFRTDTDELNAANAEADSFFCFVSLLGDFRDHFVQQLDNSAVGIRSTIARLNDLLKSKDEELWRHLEHNTKVNPQFYAFRWITLLLTQEFDFPDSLRLWDSLLGNSDGPLEILLRVCCAMLISVRSRLLAGDFTSNLKLLQHYPSIDIHHLLSVANNLKKGSYLLS